MHQLVESGIQDRSTQGEGFPTQPADLATDRNQDRLFQICLWNSRESSGIEPVLEGLLFLVVSWIRSLDISHASQSDSAI